VVGASQLEVAQQIKEFQPHKMQLREHTRGGRADESMFSSRVQSLRPSKKGKPNGLPFLLVRLLAKQLEVASQIKEFHPYKMQLREHTRGGKADESMFSSRVQSLSPF